MNKVEQGIEINKQHIYNVEHGIKEKIPFADQILALGYKSLKEFFNEKLEYEMQHILNNKVYSVEPKEAMPTLHQLIQNNRYGIVSVYTNETCVHHGQDPTKYLNRDYCTQHNIPIYSYDSFGGNIVATKDDYSVAIILPLTIDISAGFVLTKTKEILQKYFNNVEIIGNDILINNKKVAGATSFGTERYFFLIYHFSMSEKSDLIAKICGEPTSGKQPGYIDTSILPTKKLIEDFLSWLQGL